MVGNYQKKKNNGNLGTFPHKKIWQFGDIFASEIMAIGRHFQGVKKSLRMSIERHFQPLKKIQVITTIRRHLSSEKKSIKMVIEGHFQPLKEY